MDRPHPEPMPEERGVLTLTGDEGENEREGKVAGYPEAR